MTHFRGLEQPPLITADHPGREFVLKADDVGSLDIGSPVYYRHLQVGRVIARALDVDGRGVSLGIFVDAPYDRFVNPATRFFQASGIGLSLDDRGFKLNVQSATALLMGGVSFITPRRSADLRQAPAKSVFTLFSDEKTALRQPDGEADSYVFIFDETVRGLRVGSSVDFRGVPIGEVTNIGIDMPW